MKYEKMIGRDVSRSLRQLRKYQKEGTVQVLNFHRMSVHCSQLLTIKCLSNDIHEFNSRYNFEVSTRNRQVTISISFFPFSIRDTLYSKWRNYILDETFQLQKKNVCVIE